MFGLGRKKTAYPRMPEGDYEPVLRCSICTGEQTLCARDRKTGKLLELILVRSDAEIREFCAENGIDVSYVEKVW